MNIKFEYLYRDGSNYKQFGHLVLKNTTQLDVTNATKRLREFLIDGEFFEPLKVGVPTLEVYAFNPEIDHGWYEFDKFTITDESDNHELDVQDFIDLFK